MVPSTVEWSGRPPGRLAAVVRHVGVSLYVVVALFVAFVVATLALGKASRFVLFFVVVLVVGGPFSLLYLAYALRYGEDDERQTLRELFPCSHLRLRWLALATPVGALILYTVALVPWLLLGYVAVGITAWTVTTTGRRGGTLDTETGVLVREVDEGDERLEHDLSGLRSFRSLRLGPYVVCWLRYGHSRSLDHPFGMVFPADAFDDLRPALAAMTERNEVDDTDESSTVTVERIVLVGFGLVFFAVAALLATSGVPRAMGVSWLVGAWGALFVLLAWVA